MVLIIKELQHIYKYTLSVVVKYNGSYCIRLSLSVSVADCHVIENTILAFKSIQNYTL